MLALLVGKSSQQCPSDSSGTVDHGGQGTQSLGHKRAPLTGIKPQTEKIGTLPRRRDADAEGEPVRRSSHRGPISWCLICVSCQIPSSTVSLCSPRTCRQVPAQRRLPHARLMGGCGLGPLWGVHGDRVDAGAAAYGFLERHDDGQQGHPGQGLPQEARHRSSHQQHREKGTLWVTVPMPTHVIHDRRNVMQDVDTCVCWPII